MIKKQILIVDGDITHSERLKRNLEEQKKREEEERKRQELQAFLEHEKRKKED